MLHGVLNHASLTSTDNLDFRLELRMSNRRRGRAGISEVVAAVLTIAITLIAGAALFGYVNGQAATSESNLGNAVGGNVNFLNERFVVPQTTSHLTRSRSTCIIRDWSTTNSFRSKSGRSLVRRWT